MERMLVINPGSTSTKIAVYEDDKRVLSETLRHSNEDLAHFSWVMEEVEYRKSLIEQSLKDHGVSLDSLTCIMARGGMLPPVESGGYAVTQEMVDYLYSVRTGAHVSNTASVIGFEMANEVGIPAYVYDPVSVDELEPIARITGVPELPKRSQGHALNTHAMARHCARDILHKPIEDCTFIVVHIGGGISSWLIHKGRSIDMYSDDDAGFAPERSGRLQALPLIKLCYSGKYTLEQLSKMIRGNGGLRALLGTSDAREVEARIATGDEYAKLVYDAFCYGIAKSIGDLATAVRGKVDRIILTGGIAYSKMVTDCICSYVDWIAPVELMPGEFEMEALAEGGLRILHGEESPKTIDWQKYKS